MVNNFIEIERAGVENSNSIEIDVPKLE